MVAINVLQTADQSMNSAASASIHSHIHRSHGTLLTPDITVLTALMYRYCQITIQQSAMRHYRELKTNRINPYKGRYFFHSQLIMTFVVNYFKKAFHTRYRALGPELIPVYRQSARRWL